MAVPTTNNVDTRPPQKSPAISIAKSLHATVRLSFPPCGMALASERAETMLGCYTFEPDIDRETYTRGVIAILQDYPAQVVIAVTEPHAGIPVRYKWRPQLFEVKEACEAEFAPMVRGLVERHRASEQLADRARRALEQPGELNLSWGAGEAPLHDPPPGPSGKHPPGTRLQDFHAAVALYGRPIGAFEGGRDRIYGAKRGAGVI